MSYGKYALGNSLGWVSVELPSGLGSVELPKIGSFRHSFLCLGCIERVSFLCVLRLERE